MADRYWVEWVRPSDGRTLGMLQDNLGQAEANDLARRQNAAVQAMAVDGYPVNRMYVVGTEYHD